MLANEISKIEFNNAQLLDPIQILAEGAVVEGTIIKGQTLTNSRLAELYIEGEIYFEDCEFIGRLEISKTMANNSIFKNCVFHKNLIIKELESNITIISCVFHQDVLFYWDPLVDAFLIDIVDSRFNSNLTINGCNKTKIIIDTVKAIEINIGEQSDNTYVGLMNSEVQSFRINNSLIEELNVKNTKISNDLTANTANFIFLKQSEIGQIRSDDPDFWIFLQRGKLIGPLFKEKKEQEEKREYWSRVSETLLVFVNSFQKEHNYKEADMVFYLMRFARVRERFYSKKIKDKISGGLAGFFFGIIGGWGVRLLNPILTVLFMLAIYTCIYANSLKYVYLNTSIPLLLSDGFDISVQRFYNLGSKMYDKDLLGFFEVQQGILGIILNTLIIGMFIRKLVR